jgi:ATP-binding cassette subfamily D (ALD) long-chain fatty acid import protein
MSAHLVGSFRHTHSRLNEFAEEIAFLGGEETEKLLLEREYGDCHEARESCVKGTLVAWVP